MGKGSFMNWLRTIINCTCYGGAIGNLLSIFIYGDLRYSIYALVFYFFGLLQDILEELRKLNDKK